MYDRIFEKSTYFCSCSKTHKRLTKDVLIEDGALGKVADIVKGCVPFGNVGLVFFQDVEFAAFRISTELYKVGFRVAKFCFAADTEATPEACESLLNASEDIRLFVGVGGGSVADMLKYACKMRDGKFVMFSTAPSTDSIFFPYAEFYVDGSRQVFDGVAPEHVIADLNIIEHAPKKLLAAGFGTLFSKYAAMFDNEFEHLVTGREFCKPIQNKIREKLDAFFVADNTPEKKGFAENLLRTLFEVGMLEQLAGEVDFLQNVEHVFADTLRLFKDNSLTQGENKFLSAYALIGYYRAIIGFEGNDLSFPPDKIKTVKALNKEFSVPVAKNILQIYKAKKPDFGKAAFVVDEYKKDLAFELYVIGCKSEMCAKNFRRIYDDAGYFFRNYISSEQLMKIMSMSSLTKDRYSYINFCKDAGYLEKYIEV